MKKGLLGLLLCIFVPITSGGKEVIEGPIPAVSYPSSIYGLRLILDPPVPNPFDARLVVEPEKPQPEDEISIYVEGQFPTPGYEIESVALNIMESYPEQLEAVIQVRELDGMWAQVVTPFRELVGTAKISEGIHPLTGIINGVQFYRGEFLVGDAPVNETAVYNAKFVFEPENPNPGEKFSVFIEGEFPTPGYEIVEKSVNILESYPEQLSIQIKIKEPEGPQLQVITPFRELVGTASVSEGVHPVIGFINNEPVMKDLLTVGDPRQNDVTISAVVYNAKIVVEPENPQVGERFSVYVEGDFPTPGYTFTMKELLTSDSIPEHLAVNLEIAEPTEPQPEVITPFREFIGTEVLAEGVHPLYGTINGERFHNSVLVVGDPASVTLIHFTRSGGIAGFDQKMTIYNSGIAKIEDQTASSNQTNTFPLPEDTFDSVQRKMEAIDFNALEPLYALETPIADGFQYSLSYQDSKTVMVSQGAEIPAALEEAIQILEPFFIPVNNGDDETPVQKWLLF